MGLRASHVALTAGVWLLAVGLGLALHIREQGWRGMPQIALEVVCYLAALWLLWSARPVRAYMRGLPTPHRRLFQSFFLILLIGQLAHASRTTFPFPTWAMYGQAEHPEALVFYRCEGTTSDHRTVTVDVEGLLAPLTSMGVTTKLKALAKAALSHPNDAKRQARQRDLAELLRAVGALHNRAHPQRPIRRVELVRCTLNLRDRAASGLRREPVWQVDLDAGGVS